MTLIKASANPARYYEWLQHWMAIPNPQTGLGPMAETAEQTIEAVQSDNIGSEKTCSDYFVREQPARSTVEAQGRRAAS